MQKNKILAFLLALFIAVGLWVYAATVVNPNDTIYIRDVKVRIEGISDLENKNLILTSGEGQTVSVKIAGRRSDLKELNSSTLEVVADVSNIDRAGVAEVSWRLDPPSTVASGDIRTVSASTNSIRLTVSERKERQGIPIEILTEGAVPSDEYLSDEPKAGMETLSLSGPADAVERIAKAVITVDLEGRTETKTEALSFDLMDEDGNVIDKAFITLPESINVTVPVVAYRDLPLSVKMIAGGGATPQDATATLDPPTIRVVGSKEDIDKLPMVLSIADIHLGDYAGKESWTVTPTLPAGVTFRGGEPSVKITLSFQNLKIRSFTIPCSEIQRLDKLTHLEFGEQSVTIKVRGVEDAINNLRQEDIIITVNMEEDYKSDSKSVKLIITLPSGAKLGVIGEYYVQVIDKTP